MDFRTLQYFLAVTKEENITRAAERLHISQPYLSKQFFHRRSGLQQMISHWANTNVEDLNIAATYNVINGSPTKFIRSALGYYLTTKDLLPNTLEEDVCFRPLHPPLEIHYALIWKRGAFLSKAAEAFLKEIKTIVNSVRPK